MIAFKKQRIVELELNRSKLWPGHDLAFLGDLLQLKLLIILDHFSELDLQPVQMLHELRQLELGIYTKSSIDFHSFPKLEGCLIEWNPGFGSIFGATNLRRFAVNKMPKKLTPLIGRFKSLEDLSILSNSSVSLDFISDFKELQQLRLVLLKKLESNSFMVTLKGLKKLWIQDCAGCSDLEPLSYLDSLEVLWLEDVGEIRNVDALLNVSSLREIGISGKSGISEGDARRLRKLPNLERLYIDGIATTTETAN